MNKHITLESPKECCGCAACVNACALNAIKMKEDGAGFVYPDVDTSVCVECSKCVNVCAFTKKGEGTNDEIAVYAVASKDRDVLRQSSSGGVFTLLAKVVLDNGGAVFGAAWNNGVSLEHVCVENESDLQRLRGSKYVQSNTGDTFRRVKQLLGDGRQVCYCGTPCQISGLKSYLGKEYDGLFCIDLVCHGVPSMKLLKDDLKHVCGDKFDAIKDIRFRDKSYGWGVKGSVVFDDSKIRYNAGNSPYYFYFLKGELYRESCYNCRYPSEGRQGDITLGDYWGIRQDLIDKMGDVDPDLGVSCVIVNTQKGQQWLSSIEDKACIALTDRQSVEKRNSQLTSPSVPLPEHEALLKGYTQSGYDVFKREYKKHTKDHIVRAVKNMIPAKIKRKINDILH